MKKIFKSTLDIGLKDSLCFRDFNAKLLELTESYRSSYNRMMRLQKDRSNPYKDENELKQAFLRNGGATINEGILEAVVSKAFKAYTKRSSNKESAKSFHVNSPKNSFISKDAMYSFYLDSPVLVNGGGYLIIPYKNDRELKIRLTDEYIPRDEYKKVAFFFNGKQWVVYLQAQREEDSYKIKKYRLDSLDVLIYEDGSGSIGEREFCSVAETEEFQKLFEQYSEEKLKGTDSRELANLIRKIKDSSRGRYLMIIRDIIKSCPKKIYLSSSADFYSQRAKNISLNVFVDLLKQATSLYGIELEAGLSYLSDENEENLTTLK